MPDARLRNRNLAVKPAILADRANLGANAAGIAQSVPQKIMVPGAFAPIHVGNPGTGPGRERLGRATAQAEAAAGAKLPGEKGIGRNFRIGDDRDQSDPGAETGRQQGVVRPDGAQAGMAPGDDVRKGGRRFPHQGGDVAIAVAGKKRRDAPDRSKRRTAGGTTRPAGG